MCCCVALVYITMKYMFYMGSVGEISKQDRELFPSVLPCCTKTASCCLPQQLLDTFPSAWESVLTV